LFNSFQLLINFHSSNKKNKILIHYNDNEDNNNKIFNIPMPHTRRNILNESLYFNNTNNLNQNLIEKKYYISPEAPDKKFDVFSTNE